MAIGNRGKQRELIGHLNEIKRQRNGKTTIKHQTENDNKLDRYDKTSKQQQQ